MERADLGEFQGFAGARSGVVPAAPHQAGSQRSSFPGPVGEFPFR